MKSKVEGRNYIVQFDGDDFSSKLNKRKTDKILKTLADSLKKISDCLQTEVKEDMDIYDFIRVLFYDDNFDEGTVKALLSDVNYAQEVLATHNDTIEDRMSVIGLENLGYKPLHWMSRPFFEKVLEDTNEKEVTEEIQCYNGTMLRRLRITLWETKPGVRSSKSIRYRKLKIGKKLLRCIQNSVVDWETKYKK